MVKNEKKRGWLDSTVGRYLFCRQPIHVQTLTFYMGPSRVVLMTEPELSPEYYWAWSHKQTTKKIWKKKFKIYMQN